MWLPLYLSLYCLGQDIAVGPAGSDPSFLLVCNGRLFFAADDGVHGTEVCTIHLTYVSLEYVHMGNQLLCHDPAL